MSVIDLRLKCKLISVKKKLPHITANNWTNKSSKNAATVKKWNTGSYIVQESSKMSAETNGAYLSIYGVEVFHTPGHFWCQQFCQGVHRGAVWGLPCRDLKRPKDKLGHFNAMPTVFRDSFSSLESGGLWNK